MDAAEYMKKPYARLVIPESDGSFRAEILEFPGCIAIGDTAAEALASLDGVAVGWVEAALEQCQKIPEPMENTGFSGKLVVRLSRSLHRKAAQIADREGVSLNHFIVNCIAENVGQHSTHSQMQRLQENTFVVYLQSNALTIQRGSQGSSGNLLTTRFLPMISFTRTQGNWLNATS
jgi:predicted HicB family RNase H-like nuclease